MVYQIAQRPERTLVEGKTCRVFRRQTRYQKRLKTFRCYQTVVMSRVKAKQ